VILLSEPKIHLLEKLEDGRPYRVMLVDEIHHGMNFVKPRNVKDWGKPGEDFSRLATTYYHRFGPFGVVMEKFCWFREPENHFNSDSRIAASLVAGANPLFGAPLPTEQIPALWSEPPVATIDLGIGTIASYARPCQHMHFYERDKRVRELSLRKEWPIDVSHLFFRDEHDLTKADTSDSKAGPHFTYLRDALARGAHVQVLTGQPLQRLAAPYRNHYEDPEHGGGPEKFYHVIVVDGLISERTAARLITKQAIETYFRHITEDGILCVHASGRSIDLPLAVPDIAAELGYSAKVGTDPAPYHKMGHMTSEWVMVARQPMYLRHLTEPPSFREALRAGRLPVRPMWSMLGR